MAVANRPSFRSRREVSTKRCDRSNWHLDLLEALLLKEDLTVLQAALEVELLLQLLQMLQVLQVAD